MQRKTKIDAESGRQDLLITREFDLPVDLLFKAFGEPELVEQWMGTKVIKLESKTNGSYQFETSDPQGNVVFQACGVFHEFSPGHRIIRTFEMLGTPFPPQLEFIDFEPLTDEVSLLKMQIVFRSATLRDQLLQLPFASGLNMAHNRLQTVLNPLK